MTKFSQEDRLAAVQAVLSGQRQNHVARRFGMSPQVIARSIGLYCLHGKEGLSSRGVNWTTEQKLEILDFMQKTHSTYKQTSIQFGISGSNTVWDWERRYLKDGKEGLENKKKGGGPKARKSKPPLSRLEELERENEYLRAENEYLKKLKALVAEREKRESETKSQQSPN